MIRRRHALAAGLSALGLSLRAGAQQRMARVGFVALPQRPAALESSRFGAFARGMRELGYVEGRTLQIDWRFADGDPQRLPDLLAELLRLKVDVIVAGATPVVAAAQKATTSVPVVMANVNDPVGSGFVRSLGRPGGNVTGHAGLSTDLGPKLVEMLLTIAPGIRRLAILVNPQNVSSDELFRRLDTAARALGAATLRVDAATVQAVEAGFAEMARAQAQGVVVGADSFFVEQRQAIAALALAHRLPSMYAFREHVEAGGLISYGQHLGDGYRRAALYVDRILKGAKPADLPVEQSSLLELVINRTTARTLGLALTMELQARADELVD
jgi:putative ABC transport system substrate-binding protein